MLTLQSYNKTGLFMLPPPTSLYGMRSPINNMNHGTPPVMPPVNYTPPSVNYEIPPGAMNMSQELPSYSQWPMMNASEENTTATLVESVATTQATTPPIKPIYYIKLKSRLSVRPSALFWRSVSRPWLHGSTSDLLDVIATSSGMKKFIF